MGQNARPQIAIVDRFFEFSLLGMLAAGYFAVVGSGYLDWPTAALTLAGLCLRGLMVAGVVHVHFSNRAVAVLTLLYIGFWPVDYFYVSGNFLTALVHLLCFLAVMKILTAKTNRDYTYVKMIAVLELLAAAVLSASLSFFGYLALFVLLAIASFASGEVRRSAQLERTVVRGGLRAFPRRLSFLSTILFTGILAMTGVMFFILPRTARAALERFVPQRYHMPGFANGITLGEIGVLKRNTSAVMHIRTDPPSDALMNVRWRGATLSRFDGKRWDNPGPDRDVTLPVAHGVLIVNTLDRTPTRPGHVIPYLVQLNDIAPEMLFIAGMPRTISINLPEVRRSAASGAYLISLPAGYHGGLMYGVYSFFEDESAPVQSTPPPLSPGQRTQLLQLPEIDPRIPRLARKMTAGAVGEMERARQLERSLRTEYGYTLELLPAEVPDPLANFLFDRRKGHCEYFASAMAVMLRTMGIPSRVVTGFQSGVFNPMTHLQVVRASDAHSWVEAWIDGRGWTSFDPTPADPSAGVNRLSARLALFMDAAEQFWQDWVVSYDLDRQIVLAVRMDESARRLRKNWFQRAYPSLKDSASRAVKYAPFAGLLAGLIAIFAMYGRAIAAWWRGRVRVRKMARGQGIASDATLLYARMLRALARRGMHKPPWLTPGEFARVLPPSDVRGVVDEITVFYNEFRFGGRTELAPEMMQLLERLEKM
jgi:transglutaminase-like putative cysteine protease